MDPPNIYSKVTYSKTNQSTDSVYRSAPKINKNHAIAAMIINQSDISENEKTDEPAIVA